MASGYHNRGGVVQSDNYQQAYEQERARLDAAADRLAEQKAAQEAYDKTPAARHERWKEACRDRDAERAANGPDSAY